MPETTTETMTMTKHETTEVTPEALERAATLRSARALVRDENRAIGREIRRLKRWVRARPEDRGDLPSSRLWSWTGRLWSCRFDHDVYHALHAAKRAATTLCMVTAHGRGRLHAVPGVESPDQAVAALEKVVAESAGRERQGFAPVVDARLREAICAIIARSIREDVRAADEPRYRRRVASFRLVPADVAS